jgi:hypothetical protein
MCSRQAGSMPIYRRRASSRGSCPALCRVGEEMRSGSVGRSTYAVRETLRFPTSSLDPLEALGECRLGARALRVILIDKEVVDGHQQSTLDSCYVAAARRMLTSSTNFGLAVTTTLVLLQSCRCTITFTIVLALDSQAPPTSLTKGLA